MNAKLNNSNGWILCPSKSFPGKFYYFNVLTGETAWSCETDRRYLRAVNENIHRVADRLHTYPEPPEGPPPEYFNPHNYIGYSYTPKLQFESPIHRPMLSHNFGATNFTNYISRTHEMTPNIWNPFNSYATQLQTKLKVDQSIQTQDNPNAFLFGHNKTNTQPFLFKKNITSMDFGNQYNSELTPTRFIDTKSNNIQIKRSYQPSPASKLLIKEPVFQTKKSVGFSTENKFRIRSPLPNPVPSTNTDIELSWEESLEDITLKKDDLRYRLQAKRKRCEDSDEFHNNAVLHPVQKLPPSKKKVTFSFGEQNEPISNSMDDDNGVFEESTKPTLLDVQDLASLAVPTARTDVWYVLPDSEVLEKHFDVLKKLVAAAAPRLRLYVARCVFAALAACTRGVLRGSHSGLKVLDVQEPEPAMIVRNMSTVERMLNFCMFLMTKKYHAVILTKDPILYKRAKALDLHCFYINEISVTPQTREKQIRATYQNIRQTIQNDCPKETVSGNVFLQNPDKISLFPNSITLSKKQKNRIARFSQNKDNNLKYEDESPNYKMQNLHVTEQNDSEIEFSNTNEYREFECEPLSVEVSNCNWPSNHVSEPSKYHWPLSKPKETSNSNQPVSIEEEDRDWMSDIMSKLKKISVASKIVEERVRSRADEWICCLTQIMEDALSEVLMDTASTSSPVLSAPWYFNEAVVCIEQYTSDGRVAQIATVLSSMLAENSHGKYGHLKSTIPATDLLQIFGCSELLLHALQSISPNPALPPALSALRNSRHLLRSPNRDPPVGSLDEPRGILADDEQHPRNVFVKKESDVLRYLSRHFPSWRGLDEQFLLENTKDIKVIRTLGKDLKHLKIFKNTNNSTDISMNKSLDTKDPIRNENLKFIRKTNLIQSFESKLRIRERIDMDALDYEDSNELNGNEVIEGDRMTELTDDSSNESGVLAFLYVKEFLVALRRALKDVYEFIAGSVEELSTSSNKVAEAVMYRRADKMARWLHSIQELLRSIISRESDAGSKLAPLLASRVPPAEAERRAAMYSIISRESDAGSKLAPLLASRVPPAEAERRAAMYRSAVVLCEQQSSLLATCLDHLCARLHCDT